MNTENKAQQILSDIKASIEAIRNGHAKATQEEMQTLIVRQWIAEKMVELVIEDESLTIEQAFGDAVEYSHKLQGNNDALEVVLGEYLGNSTFNGWALTLAFGHHRDLQDFVYAWHLRTAAKFEALDKAAQYNEGLEAARNVADMRANLALQVTLTAQTGRRPTSTKQVLDFIVKVETRRMAKMGARIDAAQLAEIRAGVYEGEKVG